MKKVAIIMGSDSDWPVVKSACTVLKDFGIPFEAHILSAHRTPEAAADSADAGDAAAADILQQAADLVAQLVEDTAAALDMPRTEPNFIIGVWGSAILKSPRMLKTFRARLARTCPQAEIRLPQRSATEGAVAMALDLLQGA